MQILEKYHPAAIRIADQTDLISVIIAAYNAPDYIERAISSVRNQTYQNLEILVVDDGSTDDTGVICDRIACRDGRIRVIHKENGGLADSRNTGLAAAKGAYVAFMDGDDWVDPDMYEKMLATMKEQGANIAICRYRQVHRDYTEDLSVDRVVLFEGQEALQEYIRETKEYSIQNAAWNKLYKRETLNGIVFPARWYEDILFTTMALSRAERCVYLDTAYYNYIIDREGSYMNVRINEHTFTDQIPSYYDKTKFLQELGRPDLADTHDYFFFKRLLYFYEYVYGADMPQRGQYLEQLTQLIRDNREHYARAYGCAVADPRDYRKMKLFLKSPWLYIRRVQLDRKVIIPFKILIKKCLGKYKS